ncbi:MAG: hypothetical protein ABSH41_12885 [Syntrophobacteraceae bacterium]
MRNFAIPLPIEDKEIGVIGMLGMDDLLARYQQEIQRLDIEETDAEKRYFENDQVES